jgi:CheY-like chemotaxis protein
MALILVIDDDRDVRGMLDEMLRALSHTVILASEGREGLARYREAAPDVVITDMLMPVRDGLDVLLELRSDPRARIIAVSGGGLKHDMTFLDAAGQIAPCYRLAKPFTLAQLEAALAWALRPSESVEDHRNVRAPHESSPPA